MDASLSPLSVTPTLPPVKTGVLEDVRPPSGSVPPSVEHNPSPRDLQSTSAVREASTPVRQMDLPELHPLPALEGAAWLRTHKDEAPNSITASLENLIFRLADGTTAVISARQIEAMVNDPRTSEAPLAHAALIFDTGSKAGLPPSAINSILKAYAKQVGSPPSGMAQALRKAMETVALAADVENYVRNPKGLSRDMKHVGAFTDEATNGIHLKGIKSKLRSAGMKMEVIKQHQYALDDGLNRFAAAFNTARETGDYATAFDALQRFFQRAATITSTSYWQARPNLVAKDLEPPERQAKPSDLSLNVPKASHSVIDDGAKAKQERLAILKPKEPSTARKILSAIASPFVAIGELVQERRAANAQATLDGRVKQLKAAVEIAGKAEIKAEIAATPLDDDVAPDPQAVAAAQRAKEAHSALRRQLEQAESAAAGRGLVGVGAASAVLQKLRQDGSIAARGAASGTVETRAIDLNEVIIGAAWTSDLNSNSGPGSAYDHMGAVEKQKLTSFDDLPAFLVALRRQQLDAPKVRGELRHVLLNLTAHGNEWGFMSITHTDERGKVHRSHASAAWINEQLKLAGFAPTDITVVSEACNGAYVYERSRGGIDESLEVAQRVADARKKNPHAHVTVHDVEGDVRAAHQRRDEDRDFTWIGRATHENLGPSVIHQYVSGLGLSESQLAREAARRHTVEAQVHLNGSVLSEHLPIITLNEVRHAFVSDGEAPALKKTDSAQRELQLDMLAVQSALHGSEDPVAVERQHHPQSTLSRTSEPQLG